MKTKISLLLMLAIGVLFSIYSCKKKEEVDPSKTMGKVGNYWDASISGYSGTTIVIDENNGGNVAATLTFNGGTYEVEGKVTSNGIYDYVYSNGDKSKPFTLVKFDAKVGDRWEFNVGNLTVVREVVKKSTEDDTPYGFMYVKTVDVEEIIPEGLILKSTSSQVSKILWRFNHKFGFISATITKR
ncbi:MAG: hypothetical protein CVU00_08740, partial [Bacteroidetes bacterium HGW-Bacteroidetes-17]